MTDRIDLSKVKEDNSYEIYNIIKIYACLYKRRLR